MHLLADVAGYFVDGAAGARFAALSPVRVLDTRGGTGHVAVARVTPEKPLDLAVTGQHGVPAAATAVVLNVTAVAAAGGTDVRVYPAPAQGAGFPDVSNLNARLRVATPNLVVVKTGHDGKVRLRTSTAAVHLVADLAGYYAE